ncbi:MAG: NAD(P)/FAD-dependent oxidoreductase [Ignavibacteriaceae bacterium]|nr:NAD(P)/FAD-dependent oxidoreductase [Ignavibacteriaceae bacterium]
MYKKKLVIIGAGFGGLTLVKALKNADLDITLIDKTNHHLFQPLLYQVATAALSPADIAAPVRGILKKYKNVNIVLSEVTQINRSERWLIADNHKYEFDYLVLAPGSRHSYFGNNSWEEFAPGLKTLSDALHIRESILLSFENAEKSEDKNAIESLLTFVIVGGGPTGVELAGAIAEISREALAQEFRKIRPVHTRIILVEAGSKILPSYDSPLNEKALESLRKLGVEVITGKSVTGINEEGVTLSDGFIPTKNVIWAAGNVASPLIKMTTSKTDRAGRAIVNPDCSIAEDPGIFVIGDAANFTENGNTLPGVAPVAMQQGRYLARLFKKQTPAAERKPFSYWDKGNMATIGRAKAVMQVGRIKISGLVAWLAWGFIHVMYLIGFRNRYKVMAEWMWYYITYKNGARLITSDIYGKVRDVVKKGSSRLANIA